MTAESPQVLYAKWKRLTKKQQAEANLPTNQADFATLFNLTDRTLRAWHSEPAFLEIQKRLNRSPATIPVLPEKPVDPEESGEDPYAGQPLQGAEPEPVDQLSLDAGMPDAELERVYRRQAMAGDHRSATFYMTHWGAYKQKMALLATEVKYEELELVDLMLKSLIALGEETVVIWLKSQGWTVEK